MKPYKERIGGFTAQFKEQMVSLYEQGFKDGVKEGNINDGTFAEKVREAYQNGLHDAWELAQKIATMDYDEDCKIFGCENPFEYSYEDAKAMIERFEVEREKKCSDKKVGAGRWLHITLFPDDLDGQIHGECSVCHKVRIVDNYCPNCGAKMESEEV